MKRIVLISLAITAIVLAACAPRAALDEPIGYGVRGLGGGAPQESFAIPPAAPEVAGEFDKAAQPGGVDAAAVERVVLKNADVAIVVTDVAARLKAIDAMAKEMGGYVVSSSFYQTFTRNNVEVPEATIVIRVPEEKLDEALKKIESDTVEVQNENRSGQDVTAEYVDLQSRLKNLEATEAQLVKIMENATETEDVLNVFNQLTSIRGDIEIVKGQIKYYDESAALSAISVRVIAEETVQPLKIGPWTPKGAYLEAVQDLIDFLRDFADFMIRFFVLNLPRLVLIGVPLYLVFLGVREVYRRTRKPKAERPAPAKAAKK